MGFGIVCGDKNHYHQGRPDDHLHESHQRWSTATQLHAQRNGNERSAGHLHCDTLENLHGLGQYPAPSELRYLLSDCEAVGVGLLRKCYGHYSDDRDHPGRDFNGARIKYRVGTNWDTRDVVGDGRSGLGGEHCWDDSEVLLPHCKRERLDSNRLSDNRDIRCCADQAFMVNRSDLRPDGGSARNWPLHVVTGDDPDHGYQVGVALHATRTSSKGLRDRRDPFGDGTRRPVMPGIPRATAGNRSARRDS